MAVAQKRSYASTYRRVSEISPNWFETPEGFLIVPAVIAKKMILDYPEYGRKEFIGDAIFEKTFLDSANGCPVTLEHPERFGVPENVDKRNFSEHVVGIVIDPVADKESGEVRANIKLFDADVISLVKSGIVRELSQGYVCELNFNTGEFNGEKYDAEQKNILLNHIAIVKNGRAGKNVTILNSTKFFEKGGNVMNEKEEIIAGKPNPQNTTNQDEVPKEDNELTLEKLAEKVEQLALVVAKLVEAQKEDAQRDLTENAENPKPEEVVAKEEEKRENSVQKIRQLIAAELSQRERALGLAKTLIGDKAEILMRQNSNVTDFTRAVLAETGMSRVQLSRMNAVELQAWLEAKAQVAHEQRQNAVATFYVGQYNNFGDKLIVNEDF